MLASGRLYAGCGSVRARRLSGRARALLEASDLVAHILGVGADGGHGDALRVVDEVGARAHTANAVIGAIARALGLGEAGVAAKAGKGLGRDAAGPVTPHLGATSLGLYNNKRKWLYRVSRFVLARGLKPLPSCMYGEGRGKRVITNFDVRTAVARRA